MQTWQPKHVQILRLIGRWPGEESLRPSTLAARAGYSNESGVRRHLNRFEEAGLIRRISTGRGVPQILEITDEGREVAGLKQGATEFGAPKSFGVVKIPGKCGFKNVGLVSPDDLQLLGISDLFPAWRFDDLDHAIKAENDSMVAPEGRANPDSIFPGDLVHAREGVAPGQLERVYVEYETASGERECAIKLFQRAGDKIILSSLNPHYPPVAVDRSKIARVYIILDVFGRVRGGTK